MRRQCEVIGLKLPENHYAPPQTNDEYSGKKGSSERRISCYVRHRLLQKPLQSVVMRKASFSGISMDVILTASRRLLISV